MSAELIRTLTVEVMRTGLDHGQALPDLAAAIASVEAAGAGSSTSAPLPDPFRQQGLAAVDGHATPGARLFAATCGGDTPVQWRVAYPGHDDEEMRRFNAGYRFAWLAGGHDAPLACPNIGVAITFQAADIHYPSHVHRSPELYHVIAGEASWAWGGDPAIRRPPGDWINHPSGTRHAMTTHDEPMVAFAVWTAHPQSEAVIVRH